MKKKNVSIIIALIIIDQVIKLAIFNTIAQTGETINVLNIFRLNYVQNTGAAFGIFGGRILLIGLDIMIIYTILKLLLNRKYQFTPIAERGLGLIIAGGMGNLIDRIFRGYVIDYIDISNILNYPVFNLADICIVVGVILVTINILINTIKSQENANERV